MAKIRPFKALRFDEKIAGNLSDLCAPPYDIISESEQDALYSKSPYNIVQLELTRGENKYATAAETLKEWLKNGVLKQDEEPALYLYEEEFSLPDGSQKAVNGIISQVELREFADGVVLPHEEPLSKAKADRFDLMSATYCNFSQIYSLYRDETREIGRLLAAIREAAPDAEFTFSDGIIHRLWAVTERPIVEALCLAFDEKQLFIADGHHRYETALNFKKKLADEGFIKDENHNGNFIMMMLVDMEHEGLVIFPTHRMLKNLENFDVSDILERISVNFMVSPLGDTLIEEAVEAGDGPKRIVFVTGEQNYLLTFRNPLALTEAFPDGSPAYRQLDVNLLHGLILEPILGIDKANMASQKNLTYTRDAEEALEAVRSGREQCAFIIGPTLVGEIRDVSLCGEKMPQKSTYFYPKLITGLVMNKIMDIPG